MSAEIRHTPLLRPSGRGRVRRWGWLWVTLCGLGLSLTVWGQAVTPTPVKATGAAQFVPLPAGLVAENIPPVPTTLPARLSRYVNGYGLPLAGWGDGPRELWVKDYDDAGGHMARLTAPLAAPEKLFALPAQFYDLYFAPQGPYLAYTADELGNELFQIYLFDRTTGHSTPLTSGAARNVEPVWSRDGQRLAFGTTPQGQTGMTLAVLAPFAPTQPVRRLLTSPNMLQAADWSPDNTQLVAVEYLAAHTHTRLWLMNLATGRTEPLSIKSATPPTTPTAWVDPRFSPDGRGLYLLTNYAAEFRRLAYLDLQTRQLTVLTPQLAWDIEEFAVAPDGQTIAFVANEGGIAKLYLWDTAQRRLTAPAWPGVGLIAPQTYEPAAHLHWHRNSVDLAFDFVSPQTPNDIYALNIRTGEFTQWSKSVSGGVALAEFTLPRRITWRSFDGRTPEGFLYLPPARFTGPRPVIIDLHGGPEDQARPDFNGEREFLLQEMGVARIYPNVRGSTGYGRKFAALDDGVRRGDAVRDVGALLEWIATQPELDARRVLVQGGSYGGYLALSTAVAYPERIRAVISEVGPSNLVTFLQSTEGWRREQRRREYGDERKPALRAYLEKIAPRHNAHRLTAPLLVIQGQNDPRVKVSEAAGLVAAVRANGTPVWYLLGQNEGHGFSQPENRFYQTYTNILFTEAFLLNK